MTNQDKCKFECLSCGFPPTEKLIDDEGRFVAYCETCENYEVYECLLVLKSRGAHNCDNAVFTCKRCFSNECGVYILNILICTDCYYFYRYGADSFNADTNNPKNIKLAWSLKRWRKYRYNFMQPSMELIQIHDFSKTPCKICKSDLAGSRFGMELINA